MISECYSAILAFIYMYLPRRANVEKRNTDYLQISGWYIIEHCPERCSYELDKYLQTGHILRDFN